MNQDAVAYSGDTIKAMGNGKVGGYLVRFGDPSTRDLTKEYFTAKTYFGAMAGDGSDVLFHHSLPIEGVDTALTDHIFAPMKTYADSVGVFAETVLNMADEYEKTVHDLVVAGKLGWSSGAPNHAVRKSKDGEITRWPIAEGSLTPTPCEPGNRAGVQPMKSISLAEFKSLLPSIPAEPPSVKSKYLGAGTEKAASASAIGSLNDRLLYHVISPALSGGKSYEGDGEEDVDYGAMAPEDKQAHIKNAFDEFRDLSLGIIGHLSADPKAAAIAVKSIKSLYADPDNAAPRLAQLLSGMEFSEFLSVMGAVTDTATRRLAWHEESRAIKQGRSLSAANLTAMQSVSSGLAAHLALLNGVITRGGGNVPGTQADNILPTDAAPVDIIPDDAASDLPIPGKAGSVAGAMPKTHTDLESAVMDQYARSIYLMNHADQITL